MPGFDTVGPLGGLEGSAYVARVGDPSAAWFNPAGLSRQSGLIAGAAFPRVSVASDGNPSVLDVKVRHSRSGFLQPLAERERHDVKLTPARLVP